MLLQWQPSLAGTDVLGLLQLGLNCTAASATAAQKATQHAAGWLPAVLQPDVARRLITTAAARQHPALSVLAYRAEILDHVDGSTLANVLRHLAGAPAHGELLQLLRTPDAAQLDSKLVMQLLQPAVQQGDALMTDTLCKLPAAQLLTTAEVASLLPPAPGACVCGCGPRSGPARWPVLQLPVAQQLCVAEVEQLLATALQQRCRDCAAYTVDEVCMLPAARQLSPDAVAAQMCAAAELQRPRCFAPLCQLPAAQQLTSHSIPRLLQVAVQQYSVDGTWATCSLPAAQSVGSSDIVELLRTSLAAKLSRSRSVRTMVAALCQLPGARQITRADLALLLPAAVDYDGKSGDDSQGTCTAALCALPAAVQLSGDAVRRLLDAAAAWRSCKLPRLPATNETHLRNLLRRISDARVAVAAIALYEIAAAGGVLNQGNPPNFEVAAAAERLGRAFQH